MEFDLFLTKELESLATRLLLGYSESVFDPKEWHSSLCAGGVLSLDNGYACGSAFDLLEVKAPNYFASSDVSDYLPPIEIRLLEFPLKPPSN